MPLNRRVRLLPCSPAKGIALTVYLLRIEVGMDIFNDQTLSFHFRIKTASMRF
jgi:hypothetical protein